MKLIITDIENLMFPLRENIRSLIHRERSVIVSVVLDAGSKHRASACFLMVTREQGAIWVNVLNSF